MFRDFQTNLTKDAKLDLIYEMSKITAWIMDIPPSHDTPLVSGVPGPDNAWNLSNDGLTSAETKRVPRDDNT